MLGFFVFALVFITVLTLVVRLAGLCVRQDLPYAKTLGLTALFVGLLLAAWWFVTRERQTPASIFAADDLRDLPKFATKLKQSSDPVSSYLRAHLSGATQRALASYQGTASDPATLEEGLLQDLNSMVSGPCLHEATRFSEVKLRAQTQQLLTAKRNEAEEAHLNRLLLEDAYPLELSRNQQTDRMIPPLILPAPMEVVRAFVPLHLQQGLVRSAASSWLRVTTGFALAALVAVPLGVYMATFGPIAAFFRPLALASAYVPIVVLIPLSLSWFGTGETQKIGFLFIGCFVALLPLVIKDIADVQDAYLDVAVTKGASQWQLVRHVLFPVAQANIWDHMRGVYGVGWGWIIMAEIVIRPEYGLGALIGGSERRSHTDSIFAVIIVIVLIAVACDQFWRLGGELLFPYRRKE
jgi:NitT/TauT family transport system permease protein